MAALYTDEDVSYDLVTLLRASGHDVRTSEDANQRGAWDQTQMLSAWQMRQVFVTYNLKDFRLLHAAWRDWPAAWRLSPVPEHAGILVLPQPPHLADADASRLVNTILADDITLTNQMMRWKPSQGWVRQEASRTR